MIEQRRKIARIREILGERNLSGIRLRGTDWFAWATGGGSNLVLQSRESGVAEVFITAEGAWILTDVIEADRLRAEECSDAYEVWSCAWQDKAARDAFVQRSAGVFPIASDLPTGHEAALPAELQLEKRCLGAEELERYRALGRDASRAMSVALRAARPDWTGYQLAGFAARELWNQGIQPALIMVGDAARLPYYRHPIAKDGPIGDRCMMVFCARRHGLFANLTRFVYFREPSGEEVSRLHALAQVEQRAWNLSREGVTLGDVYQDMAAAYQKIGFADEIHRHHQGGITGYQAREDIAGPGNPQILKDGMALAWNPSLPGIKLEDTIIIRQNRVEVLTEDPEWPSFALPSLRRPDFMVNI